MFLTEKELKETFWKSYNNRKRAIRYRFECPIRDGNADLVTLEIYQGQYQINAFEFKLEDIKKVMLQAEGNIPFCNKSWVVVPIEKKDLILNRYVNQLQKSRYVGVMGVHPEGRYEIIYKPYFQAEFKMNQEILKLCMATN